MRATVDLAQPDPVKVIRPVLGRTIPRERLFEILDEGRVVWVTGHPGSGKTALISSYIQSRDIPCLWYRFDHSDSDIASFFCHLAAALTVPSGKCKPLSLPPPDYPGDIAAFARRFFEGLLTQVRGPAVIVFDDYQGFEQTSAIHEVIAAALASLPLDVRVLFTSRSCYPASLSTHMLHHGINILGWEKLRLTEPEALEIAKKRGTGHSRDTVRDFHKRAQGWVAGYVLLLEGGSPATKGMNQGDASPESVFKYFAAELFAKLDRTTRDFLLRTGLMPELTVVFLTKGFLQ